MNDEKINKWKISHKIEPKNNLTFKFYNKTERRYSFFVLFFYIWLVFEHPVQNFIILEKLKYQSKKREIIANSTCFENNVMLITQANHGTKYSYNFSFISSSHKNNHFSKHNVCMTRLNNFVLNIFS